MAKNVTAKQEVKQEVKSTAGIPGAVRTLQPGQQLGTPEPVMKNDAGELSVGVNPNHPSRMGVPVMSTPAQLKVLTLRKDMEEAEKQEIQEKENQTSSQPTETDRQLREAEAALQQDSLLPEAEAEDVEEDVEEVDGEEGMEGLTKATFDEVVKRLNKVVALKVIRGVIAPSSIFPPSRWQRSWLKSIVEKVDEKVKDVDWLKKMASCLCQFSEHWEPGRASRVLATLAVYEAILEVSKVGGEVDDWC